MDRFDPSNRVSHEGLSQVTNEKINQKAIILETLSKRVVALSRCLHVHAEAVIGRSRDAAHILANERNAASEDDDLIPTLRVVGR